MAGEAAIIADWSVDEQQLRRARRAALRTALVLAAVAAAFYVGFIVAHL